MSERSERTLQYGWVPDGGACGADGALVGARPGGSDGVGHPGPKGRR